MYFSSFFPHGGMPIEFSSSGHTGIRMKREIRQFFQNGTRSCFIIGSSVELCFLIEYMLLLLSSLLLCVPCVFPDDVC